MIFQNNYNHFKKKMVCFKSSSGGDSYDAAYNARMATIAESQELMAEEYFDFWESDYKPMEQAEIAANMELIPSETELSLAQNEAELSLLPGQTALTAAQTEAAMAETKAWTPVMSSFYSESLNGVDVESEANKAAADAAQSFAGSESSLSRSLAKMGVDPSSGAYAGLSNANSLEQAKTIAGAKTQARSDAEDTNYQRLTTAMGYGG
ncbi:MAG: hypothetical protein H8E41_10055 [Desulfobulbaceae bacterium]|uniref:Uncharacterized protein n=1 Tax=Candidatus Desulfobia pelagia TaxID=2841692 RepID=A0A8J6NEP5_9BACT|nr:hypothetical protein [Candidatus Desulfobia pelagia]